MVEMEVMPLTTVRDHRGGREEDHLEELSQLYARPKRRDRTGPGVPENAIRLVPSLSPELLADPLNREAQKFDFSQN